MISDNAEQTFGLIFSSRKKSKNSISSIALQYRTTVKMIRKNAALVIINLIVFQSCAIDSLAKESYSKDSPIEKTDKCEWLMDLSSKPFHGTPESINISNFTLKHLTNR